MTNKEMGTPNWYIGFKIDSPELHAAATEAPAGLSIVKTPDMHITVAFLGRCDEATARKAWALVVANPPKARTEALAKLAPIGPTAYVAELVQPQATTEYCRRIRLAIHTQFGIEDQFDPFPHVTLARLGDNPDLSEAAKRWCNDTDLSAVSVPLNQLGLFTWSDTYRQAGSPSDYAMAERLLLSDD